MYRYFFSALLVFLSSLSAWATDYVVSKPVTAATIETACERAYNNIESAPHNVVIPNGTYNNLGIVTIGAVWDGLSGKEITLKPATFGGVTFTGIFSLEIDPDFWVVNGFIFDSIEMIEGEDRIRSVRIDGNNNRVTGCKFQNFGIVKSSVTDLCIKLENGTNRTEIDHNYFYNLHAMGIATGNSSYDTHIHHNHFKDFPVDDRNSAIQIGDTQIYYEQKLNSIVEYNLFEELHGDTETISNKGSSNTYRFNVFVNSNSLAIRHSENNVIDSNYFFGTPGKESRGLEINDTGHTISNNYFQGLTHFRGVYFKGGDTTSLGVVASYFAAGNIDFINNTFANCESNYLIQFNSGDTKPYPVNNIRFKNNIFHNSKGNYIAREYGPNAAKNLTWTNNVAYTDGNYFTGMAAPISGIKYSNPNFITRNTSYGDMYVLPSSGSPARAAGTPLATVTKDIDGQKRSTQSPDIGSDEYSTEPEVQLPVNESDVGPIWEDSTSDQILGPPKDLRIRD